MRMAGITYSQAEAKLALWLDAEEKIASGQRVAMDGRTLDRADLDAVGKQIEYWDRKCKRLSSSARGNRISRVVGCRG